MARYKTLLIAAPVGLTQLSANAYIPLANSTSHLAYNGAETINWANRNVVADGFVSALAAKRGGSAGGTDILSVQRNSVNTALSVTTADADDEAEDTTDIVSLVNGDVSQLDHTNSVRYEWIRALFEPAADNSQVSLFAIRGDGTAGAAGARLATTAGTNYLPFAGGSPQSTQINGTESLAQIKVKTAGTFKNVFVHVVNNTSSTPVTFRSRVNGANGNITFTIPAGSEGRHGDITNEDDLVVDDEFCFSCPATGSGVVEFSIITSEYHHSVINGDHEIFLGRAGQTPDLIASSSSQYYTPAGDNQTGSFTEADVAISFGMDCGAQKFRMKVTSNDCSADQTFTIMKNGIATALAFTVGVGQTGEFTDDVDEIALAATDTVSIRQTGGGTGTLGYEYFALLIPGEVGTAETGEEDECGAEDEADALQTAIDWPECDLVATGITVQVVAPTVSPGRSFSGFEQLIQPDAGHWRIVLRDIPVLTKAHALQWRSIENRLKGRANPILVPVYEGRLSDVDIEAEAFGDFIIGGVSFVVHQTAGEDIQAGMHFQVGEWMYRIASVDEEAIEGTFAVTIWPPLRQAVADGEELNFNDPKCRCRLEADDGMDINLELLRFGNASVAFVEDV